MSRPICFTLVLTLSLAACGGDSGGSGDGSGDSALASADTSCVSGTPTLTAGGIGPLRIGAPISDVQGRCDVRDTSFTVGEAMDEAGRVVDLGDGSVLALTNESGVVTRIIVEDEAIRTERGLGVGSTVGDLRREHGMLCAEEGEGVVVVSSGNLGAMSFATDADMRAVRRGASIDADAIPDDARITRMWVFEGRALCGAS